MLTPWATTLQRQKDNSHTDRLTKECHTYSRLTIETTFDGARDIIHIGVDQQLKVILVSI